MVAAQKSEGHSSLQLQSHGDFQGQAQFGGHSGFPTGPPASHYHGYFPDKSLDNCKNHPGRDNTENIDRANTSVADKAYSRQRSESETLLKDAVCNHDNQSADQMEKTDRPKRCPEDKDAETCGKNEKQECNLLCLRQKSGLTTQELADCTNKGIQKKTTRNRDGGFLDSNKIDSLNNKMAPPVLDKNSRYTTSIVLSDKFDPMNKKVAPHVDSVSTKGAPLPRPLDKNDKSLKTQEHRSIEEVRSMCTIDKNHPVNKMSVFDCFNSEHFTADYREDSTYQKERLLIHQETGNHPAHIVPQPLFECPPSNTKMELIEKALSEVRLLMASIMPCHDVIMQFKTFINMMTKMASNDNLYAKLGDISECADAPVKSQFETMSKSGVDCTEGPRLVVTPGDAVKCQEDGKSDMELMKRRPECEERREEREPVEHEDIEEKQDGEPEKDSLKTRKTQQGEQKTEDDEKSWNVETRDLKYYIRHKFKLGMVRNRIFLTSIPESAENEGQCMPGEVTMTSQEAYPKVTGEVTMTSLEADPNMAGEVTMTSQEADQAMPSEITMTSLEADPNVTGEVTMMSKDTDQAMPSEVKMTSQEHGEYLVIPRGGLSEGQIQDRHLQLRTQQGSKDGRNPHPPTQAGGRNPPCLSEVNSPQGKRIQSQDRPRRNRMTRSRDPGCPPASRKGRGTSSKDPGCPPRSRRDQGCPPRSRRDQGCPPRSRRNQGCPPRSRRDQGCTNPQIQPLPIKYGEIPAKLSSIGKPNQEKYEGMKSEKSGVISKVTRQNEGDWMVRSPHRSADPALTTDWLKLQDVDPRSWKARTNSAGSGGSGCQGYGGGDNRGNQNGSRFPAGRHSRSGGDEGSDENDGGDKRRPAGNRHGNSSPVEDSPPSASNHGDGRNHMIVPDYRGVRKKHAELERLGVDVWMALGKLGEKYKQDSVLNHLHILLCSLDCPPDPVGPRREKILGELVACLVRCLEVVEDKTRLSSDCEVCRYLDLLISHAARDTNPTCVDCHVVMEILLSHVHHCLHTAYSRSNNISRGPVNDCSLSICQYLMIQAVSATYRDVINQLTAEPRTLKQYLRTVYRTEGLGLPPIILRQDHTPLHPGSVNPGSVNPGSVFQTRDGGQSADPHSWFPSGVDLYGPSLLPVTPSAGAHQEPYSIPPQALTDLTPRSGSPNVLPTPAISDLPAVQATPPTAGIPGPSAAQATPPTLARRLNPPPSRRPPTATTSVRDRGGEMHWVHPAGVTSLPAGYDMAQHRAGRVKYGTPAELRAAGERWMEKRDDFVNMRTTMSDLLGPVEGVILIKELMILQGQYEKNVQWKATCVLGNGTSGQVSLAVDLGPHKFKFCVKKVMLAKFDQQELEIWSGLFHPNIVQLYGATRQGDVVYIFEEFIEGGSLEGFIRSESPEGLNSWLAIKYLQQILNVLVYLRGRKVLHEDIKAANLMLRSGTTELVMIDFGLSQLVLPPCGEERRGNPVGTQTHWSPEKAGCDNHSYPAEVWAAMCTFVQMLSGHAPWVRQYSAAQTLHYVIVQHSPPFDDIPANLPEDIHNLILHGWVVNPRERASAENLLKLPIIRDIDSCDLDDDRFYQHLPPEEFVIQSTEGVTEPGSLTPSIGGTARTGPSSVNLEPSSILEVTSRDYSLESSTGYLQLSMSEGKNARSRVVTSVPPEEAQQGAPAEVPKMPVVPENYYPGLEIAETSRNSLYISVEQDLVAPATEGVLLNPTPARIHLDNGGTRDPCPEGLALPGSAPRQTLAGRHPRSLSETSPSHQTPSPHDQPRSLPSLHSQEPFDTPPKEPQSAIDRYSQAPGTEDNSTSTVREPLTGNLSEPVLPDLSVFETSPTNSLKSDTPNEPVIATTSDVTMTTHISQVAPLAPPVGVHRGPQLDLLESAEGEKEEEDDLVPTDLTFAGMPVSPSTGFLSLTPTPSGPWTTPPGRSGPRLMSNSPGASTRPGYAGHPLRDQPARGQREQPLRDQPARGQPLREQPLREQPLREQPLREQPLREQPLREQPLREPLRDQPARGQPLRDQPARGQPLREQREQPLREQPEVSAVRHSSPALPIPNPLLRCKQDSQQPPANRASADLRVLLSRQPVPIDSMESESLYLQHSLREEPVEDSLETSSRTREPPGGWGGARPKVYGQGQQGQGRRSDREDEGQELQDARPQREPLIPSFPSHILRSGHSAGELSGPWPLDSSGPSPRQREPLLPAVLESVLESGMSSVGTGLGDLNEPQGPPQGHPQGPPKGLYNLPVPQADTSQGSHPGALLPAVLSEAISLSITEYTPKPADRVSIPTLLTQNLADRVSVPTLLTQNSEPQEAMLFSPQPSFHGNQCVSNGNQPGLQCIAEDALPDLDIFRSDSDTLEADRGDLDRAMEELQALEVTAASDLTPGEVTAPSDLTLGSVSADRAGSGRRVPISRAPLTELVEETEPPSPLMVLPSHPSHPPFRHSQSEPVLPLSSTGTPTHRKTSEPIISGHIGSPYNHQGGYFGPRSHEDRVSQAEREEDKLRENLVRELEQSESSMSTLFYDLLEVTNSSGDEQKVLSSELDETHISSGEAALSNSPEVGSCDSDRDLRLLIEPYMSTTVGPPSPRAFRVEFHHLPGSRQPSEDDETRPVIPSPSEDHGGRPLQEMICSMMLSVGMNYTWDEVILTASHQIHDKGYCKFTIYDQEKNFIQLDGDVPRDQGNPLVVYVAMVNDNSQWEWRVVDSGIVYNNFRDVCPAPGLLCLRVE